MFSNKGRAGGSSHPPRKKTAVPEGEQLSEAGRMGPFTRYPVYSVAWGGDSQGEGEHHTLSLAGWLAPGS